MCDEQIYDGWFRCMAGKLGHCRLSGHYQLMDAGGGGSWGAPPGGWSELAIVDLVGDERLYWAADYEWLAYVFTMPLYLLLFAIGLLFIIMGMVFWRK